MTYQLILKPRGLEAGTSSWHDIYVLGPALESMARGKPLAKMSVQLTISRKILIAKKEAGLSPGNIENTVTIELKNSEAEIFWKEIGKLAPEQYGRTINGQLSIPPLGYLDEMLHDIADQLDEKMPKPDDD